MDTYTILSIFASTFALVYAGISVFFDEKKWAVAVTRLVLALSIFVAFAWKVLIDFRYGEVVFDNLLIAIGTLFFVVFNAYLLGKAKK